MPQKYTEWQREQYIIVTLKMRKIGDKKLIDALAQVVAEKRTSRSEYIRNAIIEKLLRDGKAPL